MAFGLVLQASRNSGEKSPSATVALQVFGFVPRTSRCQIQIQSLEAISPDNKTKHRSRLGTDRHNHIISSSWEGLDALDGTRGRKGALREWETKDKRWKQPIISCARMCILYSARSRIPRPSLASPLVLVLDLLLLVRIDSAAMPIRWCIDARLLRSYISLDTPYLSSD